MQTKDKRINYSENKEAARAVKRYSKRLRLQLAG
jgi:hypothetical protein